MDTYKPEPLDVSDIELPEELLKLEELITKNTHEVWSQTRISTGWHYGQQRNDRLKETPCLVPYEHLPESEKHYDRVISMNVIKLIIKLGYDITKRRDIIV